LLQLCLWFLWCRLHRCYLFDRWIPLDRLDPFYRLRRCFLCRRLHLLDRFGRLNQ